MGPRQITAWPSGTNMPIEMTFTPEAPTGGIIIPSITCGSWPMPSMRGMEKP